jgi:uncharacterized protein (TIGR03545 family)
MKTKRASKPKGWIRWKGLIAAVVLAAGWFLITAVFMDGWLERGIEKAGEAALGAKVEIDGFDLKLSDLSVRWTRLQAADPGRPMRNILETGRNAFRMNPAALFRGKIVIEEMALEDVRSGTARATDGSLPKKPSSSRKDRSDFLDGIKEKIRVDVASMPVLNFNPLVFRKKLNIDSLVAMADLKTPRRIDSLRMEGKAAVASWESFQSRFKPDEDLRRIKADFEGVEPRKIRTVQEGLELVEKARLARKNLAAISDTFNTAQKSIRADIRRFSEVPGLAKNWVEEDYRSVARMARLPDLSFRSIAKMLAGGTISDQADRVLTGYQTVRKYLPRKGKPEKESRPRFKGQDIHFESMHAYPSFLIRKIRLSGRVEPGSGRNDLALAGEINNVTAQPWIIGKPLTVDLSGSSADGRSVSLQAVLDHVTEAASDSVHVRFGNVSLNNVSISNAAWLPSKVRTGRADFDLTLRFKENDFLGGLDMRAGGVVLDLPDSAASGFLNGLIRGVLGRMDRVNLGVQAEQRREAFRFDVRSNIDAIVSAELKSVGSKALAETVEKIRARLDGIRAQKLAEFEAAVGSKQPAMAEALNQYEKWIGDDRSMLDGKIDALLKEIEKRKKGEENKLKDRAKEALDGVLNR